MKRPPYLQQGDTIAIVGLAKKVDRQHIDLAIDVFESWGLRVELGANLFNDHFRFSATDELRTLDFQRALDDPNIKTIVSARGGYGSMRVVDKVDWSLFFNHPKWIIGFSDITAVLGHVFNQQVMSIHGIMPAFFGLPHAEGSLSALKKVLFGEEVTLSFTSGSVNCQGRASGVLVGGNLSLLCNIMNSPSDFHYEDKILFIEEIDEYLYRVDRMLLQLKRAGRLDRLKGLLVGHFTDMKDNEGDPFGKAVPELIREHVEGLNIPVAFGLPVGHDAVNMPLIIGQKYDVEVAPERTILEPQLEE